MPFLGRRPYQEYSHDQVKTFVCQLGGHPSVPPLCPPSLADPLSQCWSFDPKDRPSFDSLLRCLEDLERSKSELQGKMCCMYSPSWMSNSRSRRGTTSSGISQMSGHTTLSSTSSDVWRKMKSCDEEDNHGASLYTPMQRVLDEEFEKNS